MYGGLTMIVSDSTQSSRKSRQTLQSTKPQAKKQISPLRQRMITKHKASGEETDLTVASTHDL